MRAGAMTINKASDVGSRGRWRHPGGLSRPLTPTGATITVAPPTTPARPIALAVHGHRPGPPGQTPAGRPAHVPLCRPLEAKAEMGLLPPYCLWLVRKFFQNFNPDKSGYISYPPVYGTQGEKIQIDFQSEGKPERSCSWPAPRTPILRGKLPPRLPPQMPVRIFEPRFRAGQVNRNKG